MTLLTPHHDDHWRLLTSKNLSVRRLWGWGHSIQKIIAVSEPRPFGSGRLLVASDFGGEHRRATHLIYCYLVVRKPGAWLSAIKSARHGLLRDGKTMSYKRLDDPYRQQALVPFLQAAADLDGHLVAIAVDKRKKWLTIPPEYSDDFRQSLNLKAPWNPRALENMLRKVHFVAILLSIWSRPRTNLTWITDEDEFVANDARHDDALLAIARMSSFYISHPMGVLRLNTTAQDPEKTDYEDLCAIPDLASGMLSEVSSNLSKIGSWQDHLQKDLGVDLSIKANILVDWFWDPSTRLRKTLITIDQETAAQFSVRRISLLRGQD